MKFYVQTKVERSSRSCVKLIATLIIHNFLIFNKNLVKLSQTFSNKTDLISGWTSSLKQSRLNWEDCMKYVFTIIFSPSF